MKDLVGKTIEAIFVSPGGEYLLFVTNQGDITYATRGDCCSVTWFADITGVEALIGGKVEVTWEVNMGSYNVNDGRCRQVEDIAYGYKIRTDKGYADIVFRNSSNGYYGGGIYRTHKILRRQYMRPITEDWRA